MLMDANNAILLSEKIDGVRDRFAIQDSNEGDFETLRPREFIEHCMPAWDYTNNRLLLLREGCDKAYVFKADDKTWGSMDLPSTVKTVLSSYPFSYIQFNGKENGIADGTVFVLNDDYNYTDGTPQEGLIVTRPMKLDTLLRKRITEFALNGNFSGDQEITLYGSNDLVTWHELGSTVRRRVRSMRGFYFKYWRFGIAASLKENENISSLSIRYDVKDDGRLS